MNPQQGSNHIHNNGTVPPFVGSCFETSQRQQQASKAEAFDLPATSEYYENASQASFGAPPPKMMRTNATLDMSSQTHVANDETPPDWVAFETNPTTKEPVLDMSLREGLGMGFPKIRIALNNRYWMQIQSTVSRQYRKHYNQLVITRDPLEGEKDKDGNPSKPFGIAMPEKLAEPLFKATGFILGFHQSEIEKLLETRRQRLQRGGG